jgi:hypothetical protein
MQIANRALGPFFLLPALTGCTSLFYVHDPQAGVISAGQLPSFLKSIRCELITFYELERQRKAAYIILAKTAPDEAFRRYSYFEVAPKLYGAFTVELKVTDSAGLGAGTSEDFKRILSPSSSETIHVGPTLSGQGTYDLIWSFLMKQDASPLSVSPTAQWPSANDSRASCYSARIMNLDDLEGLAESGQVELVNFTRITVNGQKPLAAWLRDNGSLMSENFLYPATGTEKAEPAQMYYSFAVQVIGGIEAKYSLITVSWNPLAVQGTGSLQQNSNLQLYINGPGSAYANAARSGSSGFAIPKPELGSSENPMHIVESKEKEQTKGTPGNEPIKPAARQPRPPREPIGRERPYLLAPNAVFPPSPSQ